MAGRLPPHLASLLKHRQSNAAETAPAADDALAAHASKRQRAREQRKVKAAASREEAKKAEAAELEALQQQIQEERASKKAAAAAAEKAKARAEKKAKAEEAEAEEAEAEEPVAKKKVVKKKKLKAKRVRPEPVLEESADAGQSKDVEDSGPVIDPDGAERDARLIRDLEAQLGIGHDPAQRRKAGRKIFDYLGFEEEDQTGIEELPSSDEEGMGEAGGKSLVDLLDNILGPSGVGGASAEDSDADAPSAPKKPRKKLVSSAAEGQKKKKKKTGP